MKCEFDVCKLARKMVEDKMCHYMCGSAHQLVNIIHCGIGDEL